MVLLVLFYLINVTVPFNVCDQPVFPSVYFSIYTKVPVGWAVPFNFPSHPFVLSLVSRMICPQRLNIFSLNSLITSMPVTGTHHLTHHHSA
jgi:hypothetical protein